MNTEAARQQMIAQQVRTWEVTDTGVLAALAALPREHFVPSMYADLAFADTEIPLGHGQSMLLPQLEGRILQSLALQPADTVLEIGTGSGYLSACLSRLAAAVTSVEIFADFVTAAQRRLQVAGINNVQLHCMDALAELPAGEYDAILVSGSTPTLHEPFRNALKRGGRLFTVVGEPPVKNAMLLTRGNGSLSPTRILFETDITELLNVQRPARFFF
jgi:protein-L-isoaspartate(D-aspartate) O-methyltransferase